MQYNLISDSIKHPYVIYVMFILYLDHARERNKIEYRSINYLACTCNIIIMFYWLPVNPIPMDCLTGTSGKCTGVKRHICPKA